MGDGPVRVVSSNAEQMFLAITPAEAAGLPHYTGEMELTNHSAGSLTSQAYQKRWLRKEELLAEAAEKLLWPRNGWARATIHSSA